MNSCSDYGFFFFFLVYDMILHRTLFTDITNFMSL